ncbi:unnamed protein product [Colias eurytheme]|nr:unnamed protein product [Colias eurytheme]
MSKCSACGKFVSATDGVKCLGCNSLYDRICLKISKTSKLPPNWVCPMCISKQPRKDNTETPVKSLSGVSLEDPAGTSDVQVSVLQELKLLRSDLKHELSCFRLELTNIGSRVDTLMTMISDLKQRLDDVEVKVSTLESQNDSRTNSEFTQSLSDSISKLKTELNDRDQEMLLTNIEITGLPEREGENVVHLVSLVAAKLDIQIDQKEIVSAHRCGTNNNKRDITGTLSRRPISVRLCRRSLRDEFLRKARVRRGVDTSGMELPGTPQKFYVNERLTKFNRYLFHKAREEGRRCGWKYIWTKEGRIYARRNPDSTSKRIRSEEDLPLVFGSLSI